MIPPQLSRSLAALALLGLPGAVRAQSVERAVFLVRQGSDTLGVESTSRAGGHAEGRLLVRMPVVRIGQQITLNDAGVVEHLVTTVAAGVRGDSVQQRAELTFHGDTAFSHVEAGATRVPDRRVAVPAGSIPFVNLSGLSVELILRRARAIGGDQASVPVLLLGGQSVVGTVLRAGRDSSVITLGGVVLRARVDAQGRFLGGVVPSQNIYFERLPGSSPVGAWTPRTVSYDAPAGAPYSAEEVQLRTSAGLTLSGTLTLPRRAAARAPAVVLITGSGAQDRDEASPSLGPWRPFREIADTLSRRGIAVLRLDDRGVGGSDAGPATATSADYADDVRGALAWLRARPDIDGARLGLVGHSEGAIIAPMVAAADSTLRGIVLIAGTAITGRALLEAQRQYLFSRDTTMPRARRDSLLLVASHEADSAYRVPGWLHFFADYDPLPTARRVRVPTLVLQGETDRQVPAAQARAIADAMRAGGNRRVTLRTFPRMNHLMVDDPVGDPLAYRTLPDLHVRKDLLGALADWLTETL